MLARVSEERTVYQRRWEANPSWANSPGKWVEEEVKVRDNFEPKPSVQVMLGKMIAEEVKREGLLVLVKEYLEYKLSERLKQG